MLMKILILLSFDVEDFLLVSLKYSLGGNIGLAFSLEIIIGLKKKKITNNTEIHSLHVSLCQRRGTTAQYNKSVENLGSQIDSECENFFLATLQNIFILDLQWR